MSKFAIFVTVKIKPDQLENFLAQAYANATATIRDEPDCHMFRVMTNQEEENTVHFYEVYTSAASLDKHRTTVHYKAYDTATKDMIASKAITRLDVLQ